MSDTKHTPGPWSKPQLALDNTTWFIGDRNGNRDIAIVEIRYAPSAERERCDEILRPAVTPSLFEDDDARDKSRPYWTR